jgi:hypothetical protein
MKHCLTINKTVAIAPVIYWCENWAVVARMEEDLRMVRRNVWVQLQDVRFVAITQVENKADN